MPTIPKKLPKEIIDEYVIEDNTFKKEVTFHTVDNVLIEVGDSKQIDFEDQVKFSRFNNKANISFRYIDEDNSKKVVAKDSIISVEKASKKLNFYRITDENNVDKAYEFDIELKVKPASNRFDFSLNLKNISLHAQSFLTQEQIASGIRRPEHIQGSYVVKMNSTPLNVKDKKGNYIHWEKNGKIGVIYRPKIIDANGNWVWGSLEYNKTTNILSVIAPQEFLDSGVYPIKVDPTFGYDTAGSTDSAFLGIDHAIAQKLRSPDHGIVESISIYGEVSSNTASAKGLIALETTKELITNGVGTATNFPVGTPDWFNLNFSGNPIINFKENYLFGLVSTNTGTNPYISYDELGGDTFYQTGNDYDVPTNLTGGDYTTFPNVDLSLYITYSIEETRSSLVKVGNFALNTSTGNQSITGVGFKPKVVLFFISQQTSVGSVDDNVFNFNIGISRDQQSSAGFSSLVNENPSVAISIRSLSACMRLRRTVGGGYDLEANFISQDSDGFTFNITTAPAGAYIVNYIALAGTSLEDALIAGFQSPSSDGNQALSGFGFQPDFLLLSTAAYSATGPNGAFTGGSFGFGAGKSSSNRFAFSTYAVSASSTNSSGSSPVLNNKNFSNKIYPFSISGATANASDIVSFDSDGVTLNWVYNGTVVQSWVFIFALKGFPINIGTLLTPNEDDNGVKNYSVSSYKPKAVLLVTGNGVDDNTTLINSTKANFGAFDNLGNQFSRAGQSFSGISTTNNTSSLYLDRVIDKYTLDDSASYIKASGNGFLSDGFSLDWEETNIANRRFGYITFGEEVDIEDEETLAITSFLEGTPLETLASLSLLEEEDLESFASSVDLEAFDIKSLANLIVLEESVSSTTANLILLEDGDLETISNSIILEEVVINSLAVNIELEESFEELLTISLQADLQESNEFSFASNVDFADDMLVHYNLNGDLNPSSSVLGVIGSPLQDSGFLAVFEYPADYGLSGAPVIRIVGKQSAVDPYLDAITDNTYFYITVYPYAKDFTLRKLMFRVVRGGAAGIRYLTVRASTDNYTANIFSEALTNTRPSWRGIQIDLDSSFENLSEPVTFRFYVGAEGNNQSLEFDNIAFTGEILTGDETSQGTIPFDLELEPSFARAIPQQSLLEAQILDTIPFKVEFIDPGGTEREGFSCSVDFDRDVAWCAWSEVREFEIVAGVGERLAILAELASQNIVSFSNKIEFEYEQENTLACNITFEISDAVSTLANLSTLEAFELETVAFTTQLEDELITNLANKVELEEEAVDTLAFNIILENELVQTFANTILLEDFGVTNLAITIDLDNFDLTTLANQILLEASQFNTFANTILFEADDNITAFGNLVELGNVSWCAWSDPRIIEALPGAEITEPFAVTAQLESSHIDSVAISALFAIETENTFAINIDFDRAVQIPLNIFLEKEITDTLAVNIFLQTEGFETFALGILLEETTQNVLASLVELELENEDTLAVNTLLALTGINTISFITDLEESFFTTFATTLFLEATTLETVANIITLETSELATLGIAVFLQTEGRETLAITTQLEEVTQSRFSVLIEFEEGNISTLSSSVEFQNEQLGTLANASLFETSLIKTFAGFIDFEGDIVNTIAGKIELELSNESTFASNIFLESLNKETLSLTSTLETSGASELAVNILLAFEDKELLASDVDLDYESFGNIAVWIDFVEPFRFRAFANTVIFDIPREDEGYILVTTEVDYLLVTVEADYLLVTVEDNSISVTVSL